MREDSSQVEERRRVAHGRIGAAAFWRIIPGGRIDVIDEDPVDGHQHSDLFVTKLLMQRFQRGVRRDARVQVRILLRKPQLLAAIALLVDTLGCFRGGPPQLERFWSNQRALKRKHETCGPR